MPNISEDNSSDDTNSTTDNNISENSDINSTDIPLVKKSDSFETPPNIPIID